MHERDWIAKMASLYRRQMHHNVATAPATFSLFKASGIAVAGAAFVCAICGVLGDNLVHLVSLNPHEALAFCEILAAPLLSGLALGMLIKKADTFPKPSLGQAGLAVWGWLLAAELIYCFSAGMPPLLTVIVLFTYGFFLQLLVFGLAVLGGFVARYTKP